MGFIFLFHAAGCASWTGPIDDSIGRGKAYLVSRQSPDGAWRSHVYGLMKDGPSLTGHVANSIDDPSARLRAARYLAEVGRQEAVDRPSRLIYPVYTAADAMILLPAEGFPTAHVRWREFLLKQQLNQSLGWRFGDREFGGWSYALRPPRAPPPGQIHGEWDWSNLSATRYALSSVRSDPTPATDAVYADALIFIRRCQNPDGGFFFACGDELHNKAGTSGRDAQGNPRFNSYGSATVDGYAALRLCGLPPNDPAVIAAANWLHAFDAVDHNPGHFIPANEDIRDATYFYYCRGLAWFCADRHERALARRLAAALLARQRADGSWSNPFTDAKEDDPLVATPMALEALRDCRKAMR